MDVLSSEIYKISFVVPLHFLLHLFSFTGSRDGVVVRALASHQCGPGSIPGLGVICGLSLLLALVPALRVFLRVLFLRNLVSNLRKREKTQPNILYASASKQNTEI